MDVLAEIDQRCRSDTVGAFPEKDFVEIQLKDFLLRQFIFDAQREQNFLELAGEGALVAEEHIARELHRDRAAALALLAGQREYERGAHQALPVDARVLEETSVLGGEKRMDDVRRDVVVAQQRATLGAELAEQDRKSVV